MKRLLLCGAGGHAKVIVDVLRAAGEHREILFVDAKSELVGTTFLGYEVRRLDSIEDFQQSDCDSFLVSIGDNAARAMNYERLLRFGISPVTAIHPSAVVSPSARIGHGTVVMPRAVINAQAQIGQNCIINSGAIVEHDCVIGDHVHVSPGAALGGGAILQSLVHVGLHASVLPGVSVGRSSVVGAGAVVVASVRDNVVVTGIPARVQRSLTTES
jgi:sugar O-acyltransferase (sialic acid O-acetyltransferase NeuD family)